MTDDDLEAFASLGRLVPFGINRKPLPPQGRKGRFRGTTLFPPGAIDTSLEALGRGNGRTRTGLLACVRPANSQATFGGGTGGAYSLGPPFSGSTVDAYSSCSSSLHRARAMVMTSTGNRETSLFPRLALIISQKGFPVKPCCGAQDELTPWQGSHRRITNGTNGRNTQMLKRGMCHARETGPISRLDQSFGRVCQAWRNVMGVCRAAFHGRRLLYKSVTFPSSLDGRPSIAYNGPSVSRTPPVRCRGGRRPDQSHRSRSSAPSSAWQRSSP